MAVTKIRQNRGGDLSSLVESRRLRDLLSYWQSKSGDRLAPARSDIDPVEFPGLLPIVILVDVEQRLTLRLVGTEIVRKFGTDPTREPIEFVFGDGRSGAANAVHAACREPCLLRREECNGRGVRWYYEMLLLPLRGRNGKVHQVLGGMEIKIPISELMKLDK